MIPVISQQKKELMQRELDRTGVSLDVVLERYGITSEAQLTEDIYRKAMSSLKRTKSLGQAAQNGGAVLHGLSGMLPYKRIIGSLFSEKPYIFWSQIAKKYVYKRKRGNNTYEKQNL